MDDKILPHEIEFEAIGTHWEITATCDDNRWEHALQTALEVVEAFDKNYSRFRADSWVTEIKNRPGAHHIPSDLLPLWQLYQKLYTLTEGLFTPLIGDTLADSGYDATYSLQSKPLHSPPRWEETMTLQGEILTTHASVLLDFGAGGKGYLIDLVSNVYRDTGVGEFLIDAGGDIRHFSDTGKICRIGLEHPDDFSLVLGVVHLENQSIAGSAGNRRAWGNYHHILNPKTLQSVREIKAVWVIADTTLLADCLSTCLFFVKPEILQDVGNFSYLIVYEDLSIDRSENFPGEIFVA